MVESALRTRSARFSVALFVNVRHRTFPGTMPRWSASMAPSPTSARYTTRAAMTEVLPEPGPGDDGARLGRH